MGVWDWITSGKHGSAKANDEARRPKRKSSSLIGAIIGGNEAAIEQILGDGPDIREVTAAGQTVLHVAISNCMYSVAERLLDAGADVNAQNEYGMTPLHSLIVGFDADVASRMLVNRERYNPSLATRLAHRLVRSGVDLTLCRHEDGATALMLAAAVGSEDIVVLLLWAGASVNVSSPGGPALLRAASEGHVGIVQTLLRNGAHIDSTDKSLQTALMEASANGHQSVVQMLLDAGADPNRQSKSGFTALMYAAGFGRSSVVKQLMVAGAKPSICDVEGQTAVDHARRGEGAKLVHLIEQAICPECQARAEDSSDGFFRSFYVSFDCKCGETVEINGKRVDRLLGLSVMHSACRATAYVPPTAWCPTCRQNLVAKWKSLIVFDGGEAAVRVLRALQSQEKRRVGPLFHAPKDAQRLRPPLMNCPCDNCGNLHWWTPDGHVPWLSGDLDNQAPLRCSDCGRWAVLWETLLDSTSNPTAPAAPPSTVAAQESSGPPEGVMYVRTDRSATSTYEIYKANDAETAKAFLLTKRLDATKYYIMVETPEGAWGLDKLGLYLEHLLPFQKYPEAAECEIKAYGIPDPVGLEMAANGINESFVIRLQCGDCQRKWLDAVRYQTKTAVRCPTCKKVNLANTTNIQRITIQTYPLFERFLAGLTDNGRSSASSAMSSISLANEILGVYPTDDSFSAALQYAQSLPEHFHPIGMRLSPGGALYVRCAFMSTAEFNSVMSTLKQGCANLWTEPQEAHLVTDDPLIEPANHAADLNLPKPPSDLIRPEKARAQVFPTGDQRKKQLLHQIGVLFQGDQRVIDRWLNSASARMPCATLLERYEWIIESYEKDNR